MAKDQPPKPSSKPDKNPAHQTEAERGEFSQPQRTDHLTRETDVARGSERENRDRSGPR